MEGNATDKVNHYDIKEGYDSHQPQYITWLKQDADDN